MNSDPLMDELSTEDKKIVEVQLTLRQKIYHYELISQ